MDVLDGYKCECIVGYHGDGKTCKPADECELGIHKCHQRATCINTLKSYECSCKKGYEGNGFTCKDVDECANNQNDCGFRKDGFECFNTNGSYMCACRDGFTGDGKTCTNIDECKTGAHDCVENAICTDRKGIFSCKCTSGFSGNATEKCIGECRDEAIICRLHLLKHDRMHATFRCTGVVNHWSHASCLKGIVAVKYWVNHYLIGNLMVFSSTFLRMICPTGWHHTTFFCVWRRNLKGQRQIQACTRQWKDSYKQ